MIYIYNMYINIPCIMSNHEGKTLKWWYSEDMVRAVALVNEGMATSEAAQVCNELISTLGYRISKCCYPTNV